MIHNCIIFGEHKLYPLITAIFIITFLISLSSKLIADKNPVFLNLILSFSGAFLLGITLLHIFPHLYEEESSTFIVGIFIMIGFFIQVVLESYSKGIEHGHIHLHDFKKTPYSLFVALCLHATLEGGVLTAPYSLELVSAILIHKIPVSFLLGLLLFTTSKNNTLPILLLIIFAICTPLGSFIGNQFNDSFFLNTEISLLLMAVVTGSFLHISTTILFETSPEHKLKINKFLPALLGGFLAVLSSLLHFH